MQHKNGLKHGKASEAILATFQALSPVYLKTEHLSL